MGTEDSVTDEAKFAAVGFEDEEALIQMRSLYKLMTIEESGLLFGNNSLDLGTTPTPTCSRRRRRHAAERHLLGHLRRAVGRRPRQRVGRRRPAAAGLGHVERRPGRVHPERRIGGQVGGGHAGHHRHAEPQLHRRGRERRGGYAWFVGTAGSEKLEKITTINSAVFSAPLAGTGQAATAITANWSKNSTAYDGLVTQTYNNSGNGAYIKALGHRHRRRRHAADRDGLG
jgi:hypothetical protein